MGKIYSIYLRQSLKKSDPRIDPLYGQGCFGSTGCHSKNVLRLERKNMFRVGNDKLCFMQGGRKNTKIVHITPSISEVTEVQDKLIIKWDSKWNEQNQHPLKYEYGLPLTNSLARKLNKNIRKEKKVEELYQHFRSRAKPLDNPNCLLTEYKKHTNEMKETFGNAIFVKNNYETFEYKNKPEFYIKNTFLWCSFKCKDKNCERRKNSLSEIGGKGPL